MATVERNLLDGLCRDDMANRGGRPIDDRHFRANEHRLSDVADGQMKVAHQRAADVHAQRFDALCAKAVRLSRDRVRAVGNREDVVPSLGISANGHIEPDRLVPHADDGPGNECAGRIEDAPLQRRKGLRPDRDKGTEHQCRGKRRTPSGDSSLTGHLGRPQHREPMDATLAWILKTAMKLGTVNNP